MKLVTAAWLVATTALLPVFAQPPAPGTPMPPYENLAFFEGKWTVEDDDREYRETCAWLPEGRRHMVCRARWKSSTGPRESMSIFSHEQGVGYVRYGLSSIGRVDRMRGRLDGGPWKQSADVRYLRLP